MVFSIDSAVTHFHRIKMRSVYYSIDTSIAWRGHVRAMEINAGDDAWHNSIVPQYVEWWYLDALFVSDYHLAGSFGIWGNIQRPRSLVIRSDFLLTTPSGTIVDFGQRVQFSAFRASVEKCDIVLGENHLRDLGGHYLLHLQNDSGEVTLDLAFIPEYSGFKHKHFFGGDETKYLSWVVSAPRAKVQGTLQLDEEQITLEGIGYHDHNWASVSLSKELCGWKWGRFNSNHTTIVFATVEGRHKVLFQGMAWIEHEYPRYEYRYLRFGVLVPNVVMEEKPLGWDLVITDSDIKVLLNIERGKLLLRRGKIANYERFLSYAKGNIHTGDHEYNMTGIMVHEFQNLL